MSLKISSLAVMMLFFTSLINGQSISNKYYLSTPNANRVWKVAIFAGQSNQLSIIPEGDFSPLYTESFAAEAYKWDNDNTSWIKIGRENTPSAILEFSKLADSEGVEVRYLHSAVGATSLYGDWNPTSPGSLYTDLVDKIENIKTAAAAQNVELQWVLFDWMQGERDAKDLTGANNYETNMINLINQIRAITSSDMAVSQGKVYSFLPTASGYLYTSTVNTAKDNVATSLSDCVSYDCDVFSQNGDNVHQSADGQIERGAFLFNLLSSYLY